MPLDQQTLGERLDAFTAAGALSERTDAFVALVRWTRQGADAVFYAALTGAILWMASVAGGWFDNFCAYHRLEVAIAQHPAGHTLERDRVARWGKTLTANAAGWGTNVSLGFMLGMTPAIGR